MDEEKMVRRRQEQEGKRPKARFRRGPEEYCECTNCHTRIKHKASVPCYQRKCPNCGSAMTRAVDEFKSNIRKQ